VQEASIKSIPTQENLLYLYNSDEYDNHTVNDIEKTGSKED